MFVSVRNAEQGGDGIRGAVDDEGDADVGYGAGGELGSDVEEGPTLAILRSANDSS